MIWDFIFLLSLIILFRFCPDPFWFPSPSLDLSTPSYCSNPLPPFPPLPSRHTSPLQLGLWSRQCLRQSSRGTPLSCTAMWSVTPPQRSNGGMLRSTELTPSSSCGMGLASVGYPSTRRTAPMGSVCWESHASRWRTLGPMNAEPAMTPGAMTSGKTPPSRGSVPRPPFRCYRVSGLCPAVPRWWTAIYITLSPPLQPVKPRSPTQSLWSVAREKKTKHRALFVFHLYFFFLCIHVKCPHTIPYASLSLFPYFGKYPCCPVWNSLPKTFRPIFNCRPQTQELIPDSCFLLSWNIALMFLLSCV